MNAWSLHKHIDDVRKDLNYSSTDVNIFAGTRYACSDNNDIYAIDGYSLFRNDSPSTCGMRPYGGTAVYSCDYYYPGYPYCGNTNSTEILEPSSCHNHRSISLT